MRVRPFGGPPHACRKHHPQLRHRRGIKADLRAVRVAHDIDEQPEFSYLPRFGSRQYNDTYLDWLVAQHGGDRRFFESARHVASVRKATS